MKYLFLTLIICQFPLFGIAQETFQKTYPDSLNSKGVGLEIRNDTVFIVGTRGDGIASDLFVSALTLNGDELVGKQLSGVDNEGVLGNQGFTSTSDNGFLVTGVTESWSSAIDKRDAFLMKLNSSLDTLWTRKYNGDLDMWDFGFGVIEKTDNNYIFSYNSGTNSNRGTNLNEIDPNGNLLWNTSYVSNDLAGGNYGRGLLYSNGGSFYSFGDATCDAFIRKHDSNGNLVWDKTFNSGGCNFQGGPGSSAFMTGVYYNDTIYLSGITPENAVDSANVLLMKIDTLGNVIWSKSIGGTGNEYVQKMVVTGGGELLLTGFTNSSNYGNYDAFLYTLNLNGDTLSTTIFGGSQDEYIYDLEVYQDTIYILGSKENTSGINEVFLIKTAFDLNLCDLKPSSVNLANVTYPLHPVANPTSGIVSIENTPVNVSSSYHCDSLICFTGVIGTIDVLSACESYSWINGITYYSSNNSAIDTLFDVHGCDSIVYLDLTIFPLPTPVISLVGADLTTTTTYTSYQWLFNGSELIGETNQIYTPLVNGNYEVIVWNSNGCADTSAVFLMTNVGVAELDVNNIRIYPNPAMNQLHIESSSVANVIIINNLLGQEVLNENYSSIVDVSSLTNGVYIIELLNYSGEKMHQSKIIINK